MVPCPSGLGTRAKAALVSVRSPPCATSSSRPLLPMLLLPLALSLVLFVRPTQAFRRSQPPPTPSSSSPSTSPPSPGKRPPLPFTSRLLDSTSSSVSTPSSWPSSTTTSSSSSSPPFSSSPWESISPSSPSSFDLTPEDSGPFRLTFDEATDRFVFQTATIELQQPGGPDSARVRLVGSVHIADPTYFKALEAACADSDVVLYEMITSRGNVLTDNTDDRWPAKEQLGVELAATDALRNLASAHGLEPQLDNMHFFGKKNWYLSDITREQLCLLQRARGERALDDTTKSRFAHLQEMVQIFWDGFTSRGKVLPKFLFMRNNLSALPFRLLRLCMWLTPAPELQLLLLDWARQYPPAGGFSKILRSMVGAMVHGDLLTLRRLAFSQMLTSSQMAQAPEVLVLERNSKVVLDVEKALKSGAKEVAVLYGGLHMKDMEAKLCRHLKFQRVAVVEGEAGRVRGVQWHTAWTMPAYTAQKQALVAFLCVALPLLHLSVGGLDWSSTFGGLAKDVSQQVVSEGGGAMMEAPALGWQEVVLYLLRHMYIYYGLSRWVVEWEKQLFEMR